ncbi:MAG TPA: O-methyltransferase [Candidatus Sulfotelmatobacter sp.]|jgi:caffeoyl-CoA O-methyltransferase|nr:O-methyltransferase [Candidatus Sulfotelmatobacter sp.]
MPGILNAKVEEYIAGLLPKRDPVISEMERYAERHDVPIIGPAVARTIYLLAQISGAKRIFEMGSAIGYSTIWLARAAGPGAEVYYTDGDPANAARARGYFQRADVVHSIQIMTGDAVNLIDQVPGDFDLIFIDVDKHQYPDALAKAVPRLRSGALLITDNVLWSGRVTTKAKDASTRAIQKFNKLIYSSKTLFPIIVPLRDGVAVCRKS